MSSRRINKEKSLAVTYPELARQWHPTLNNDLSPSDIVGGSTIKVWWVCSEGHVWQAQPHHRTKDNTGCPYCSGRLAIKGKNDLETLYPELVGEWCYEKNGKLKPCDILSHSSRKVWWRCVKGHDWLATPGHRTLRHSGCPYCSGRYAIKGENDLETLYPNITKEWNQAKNGELKPCDCKAFSSRKVWWICNEGHEWQTSINHRTSKGTGCPYCSGNIVISGKTDLQTLFPKVACEFDKNKNNGILPDEICAKSGKKIWWICSKGHSWRAPVISRTNLNAGCPFCAGNRAIPGENDLATLRPDLADEWHPDKNKRLMPTNCTISSGQKVWWKCKKGHEWQAVVSSRTGQDNCGCPYCYGRYAISGVNDLATVNPELASEWHFEKNKNMKPYQVLPYTNKKVWWLCSICGFEWRMLITSRTAKGSGCPRCAGRIR